MPSKKKKYNARFPPARIKKIMQTDEDVGKVAAAVPVIISRALELFIESLILKTSDTTKSRNAKTLSTAHIKQTIQAEKKFDFLKDLVANVPDVQQGEEEGEGFTSPPEPKPEGPRPRGRPRKKRPETDSATPPLSKRPRKKKVRIEDNEETDSATEHEDPPASDAEEEMEDEEDEDQVAEEEEEEDDDMDNIQDNGSSQDQMEEALPGTSRQPPHREEVSQQNSKPQSSPQADSTSTQHWSEARREPDQENTETVSKSTDAMKSDHAIPGRTHALPPVPPQGYFPGMFHPPPPFYGSPGLRPPQDVKKEENTNSAPDSVSERKSYSPMSLPESRDGVSSQGVGKTSQEPKSKKRKNHSKDPPPVDVNSDPAKGSGNMPFNMFPPPPNVPMTTGYFPMPGVVPPIPPYLAGMPLPPFHPAMMGYPPLPLQPPMPLQGSGPEGPGSGQGASLIPPYPPHISHMMDPRYRMPGMNAMPSDSPMPKVDSPEGSAGPHSATASAKGSDDVSPASKMSADDNYDS